MKTLILITCIFPIIQVIFCNNNTSSNSSDPNKDMYVIHAMVYQVGILTNKTDDKALNSTMGNQEALTFFHTNGSKVDLSNLPVPLVTNVTAQSVVQVAPKTPDPVRKSPISWSDLKDLASLPQTPTAIKTDNGGIKIVRRSALEKIDNLELYDDTPQEAFKRSVSYLRGFKREVSDQKARVQVVKGSAVVPAAAGVQSLALPPLLTLNNNLTSIPVPIPNTSVVHYAKINTLIRQP